MIISLDNIDIACMWDRGDIFRYKKVHDEMVRAWRFADVATCRAGFEPRLGLDFHRNIMFLPSQILGQCPCARHLILKCFTWFRLKWVPGRTEMTICTKWLQGCLLSFELKWHTNGQIQWPVIGLQIWHQRINRHLYLLTWILFCKAKRHILAYLYSKRIKLTCIIYYIIKCLFFITKSLQGTYEK